MSPKGSNPKSPTRVPSNFAGFSRKGSALDLAAGSKPFYDDPKAEILFPTPANTAVLAAPLAFVTEKAHAELIMAIQARTNRCISRDIKRRIEAVPK